MSHLPLLLVPGCEPHGTLIGHMARANPHWQHAAGAESIAIFHGPHAYVSPSWYAEPSKAVPTWNYAVVHAHGTLERHRRSRRDAARARRARAPLRSESRRRHGSSRCPSAQRDALVGAIVAFRLRIRRLTAKFKLSQNRPAARSGARGGRARRRRLCRRRGGRRVDARVRRRRLERMTRDTGEHARRAGAGSACASTSGCGRRASTARAASRRRRSTPVRCASTASASSRRIRCAPAIARQRAQAGARRGTSKCSTSSERRGSATEAALLYRETAESAALREKTLRRAQAARARRRARRGARRSATGASSRIF